MLKRWENPKIKKNPMMDKNKRNKIKKSTKSKISKVEIQIDFDLFL